MSNLGNKYKVGVLAITAFALLMLGLVSLGSFKYFKRAYPFMTIVSASVQGLEKGAKVKIKGVSVGSVEKIQLGPDMKEILIYMKLDPDAFCKATRKKSELKLMSEKEAMEIFASKIDEHVANGLRCQLQYGDITGTLFVDITILDPKDNKPMEVEFAEDHPPYIPSVPTVTIENIITEVHKATQNIAKMDLQKISDQFNQFLEKANKIIDEKQIKDIVGQIESISGSLKDLSTRVNDAMSRERIDEIMANVQKSFDNINKTLDTVNKLAEDTKKDIKDANIPELSSKAKTLIESSDQTVRNIDELRSELKKNIVDLNETLQSAKQLIDYLERNPSSLLTGKPDKPVVDPE
ncbi:MAG: MlaD family protein [Victivallales bacterium]